MTANLVQAPTMSAVAIAADFRAAHLELLVDQADVVVAEQVVAGEPGLRRRIVCQQQEPGTWRVAYVVTRNRYHHDLVDRRVFKDLDELGLFVGGCLSMPVSGAEVAALNAGARLLPAEVH